MVPTPAAVLQGLQAAMTRHAAKAAAPRGGGAAGPPLGRAGAAASADLRALRRQLHEIGGEGAAAEGAAPGGDGGGGGKSGQGGGGGGGALGLPMGLGVRAARGGAPLNFSSEAEAGGARRACAPTQRDVQPG